LNQSVEASEIFRSWRKVKRQ